MIGSAAVTGPRPVDVHRATAADADALARLRWRWRTEEGGERADDVVHYAEELAAWWSARVDTHHAFIAEVDGGAVGMAWLVVIDRLPGPERWLRRAGIVQSVYVQPESRGVGVGAELVSEVVAHARTLELEYLSVHPSTRSFDLYRRAGFVESDRVLELDLVER